MCFGYRALVFMDDLFIMNRKRFESVAEHLRKHGIIWRCMVRADLLVRWGQDFVQRMADCGCRAVGMGVESGSDKILANVGKDENVDTIRKAVQLLKSANIKVKGFFILGLPGETKDTIEETRKFLEDAQLDDIDIKVFEPYPGSPIWERRELFDISWDTTNYEDMYYKGRVGDVHGHVRTSGLSSAEIVQKQLELEKEFKRG
jgi:anaerobic magnesium-protoporphyrin IX monomethyl ester cyclase